jgi:hypothetical protein
MLFSAGIQYCNVLLDLDLDPDPGGQKPYGSGSAPLPRGIRKWNNYESFLWIPVVKGIVPQAYTGVFLVM